MLLVKTSKLAFKICFIRYYENKRVVQIIAVIHKRWMIHKSRWRNHIHKTSAKNVERQIDGKDHLGSDIAV